MQTDDFAWFRDNLTTLYSTYGNTFLLIKDKLVYGTFNTYAEGVRAGESMFDKGTFIVQECGPDESAYTAFIATPGILV